MSDNIERTPLIKVDHLKEYFKISGKGMLHAVDDVNFEIYEGETLGLVGESGCGKSTVGNVIMRLLQQTDGKLYLEGENVFEASKEKKNDYCRKMQIIFQDPYSSLNPRKTIRSILSEAYIVQKLCPKEEIEGKIREAVRHRRHIPAAAGLLSSRAGRRHPPGGRHREGAVPQPQVHSVR